MLQYSGFVWITMWDTTKPGLLHYILKTLGTTKVQYVVQTAFSNRDVQRMIERQGKAFICTSFTKSKIGIQGLDREGTFLQTG